jgi:hypothetical protein
VIGLAKPMISEIVRRAMGTLRGHRPSVSGGRAGRGGDDGIDDSTVVVVTR